MHDIETNYPFSSDETARMQFLLTAEGQKENIAVLQKLTLGIFAISSQGLEQEKLT